jgi:hypothetical protein
MAGEFASPLSHEVRQRIERERRLSQVVGDCSNRPLRIISGYSPRLFVADVEPSDLLDPGDEARPNSPQRLDVPPADSLTALWHRHRK